MPPAVEAQSLNHWTTKEVLISLFSMATESGESLGPGDISVCEVGQLTGGID